MMKQLGNRRRGPVVLAAVLAGILVGVAPLGPASAQEARDTAQACAYAAESSFTDRPEDQAFSGPIDCIAWYGVARGLPDGSYGVSGLVTRGQMATFLINSVLVAGVELPEDPPDAFGDDDGHTHEANIDNAAALGIARGVTADAFRPNNAVRRDQMATFVAQSIEAITGEALPTPEEDHFGDDNGTTHETRINQLAELGIVTGTGAGVYSPAASVTRRQMALFLARDLDHLTEDQALPLRRLNPPADVMDGPELVSVDIVSQSGGNVALRFVFDETVTSIVAGAFHYYTSGGEAVDATSAARDSNNDAAVIASFPSATFDDATVATVEWNAVQSPAPESIANPEGSAALQAVELTAGSTVGPDLISVKATGDPTKYEFTFDEPATVAVTIPGSESSANYRVVQTDGTPINGNSSEPAGNESATHTVTLASAPTAAIARGFILSGTVEDADGNANPQQAVAVDANGVTTGPDLVAIRVLPGDKVEYEFDTGVALRPGDPIQGNPGGFRIYKLDGSEVTTDDRAMKPGNNAVVVATFDEGDIDSTVVGGSVDHETVQATQDSNVRNRVDSRPIDAGFAPGDTAAPTLLAAGKTAEADASFPPGSTQRQIVIVFDEAVTLTGAADPEFVLYQPDGSRVDLAGCSASGFKVTCTVNSAQSAALYAAIDTAVRLGVEAGMVENASEFTNNEASAVMI